MLITFLSWNMHMSMTFRVDSTLTCTSTLLLFINLLNILWPALLDVTSSPSHFWEVCFLTHHAILFSSCLHWHSSSIPFFFWYSSTFSLQLLSFLQYSITEFGTSKFLQCYPVSNICHFLFKFFYSTLSFLALRFLALASGVVGISARRGGLDNYH